MSPILVPTLSELQIELEKSIAVQIKAFDSYEWAVLEGAVLPVFEDAVQAAANATGTLVSQITTMPASSLADMRVKAFALNWLHAKVGGVERFRCEHRLAEQIVAGLLDGVIA